ncbi:histidinol dehydrogenase-like [Ylistrum balloti]|uniref:histidinol dehydrogenase-like n=1 Tax=Ylistrum balloti TaxID=509963 RepID=UPI002905C73B|nr:histidinol dehydrogenase-like [Ylistrum balloti]
MHKKLRPKVWSKIPKERKNRILRRSQLEIEQYSKTVPRILKEVREEGDRALLRFSKKFEGVQFKKSSELRVKEKEIQTAIRMLSPELKKALKSAYQNVHNYHISQTIAKNKPLAENGQGVFIGSSIHPVESVALYIPRGKGSFPSMAYMLAVPACLAEVPRIVMITPPLPDGSIDPATLYVAELCNISEIYKVGGAHGIAALAYGTKSIPAVHKIIGPGSAIVSAAKHFLRSVVDVGPPAGPSESLIIADGTTAADLVAYDLCIEAEHGIDSMSLLLTHKKDFAESVSKHLNKIIEQAPSPQKEILNTVFHTYYGVIVTENIQESIHISNTIAPEHLLIHSDMPSKIMSKISNAGEILLGKHSPFSIANYAAGANAVLPTGGMAKSYSGISVRDFIKESTVIQITSRGYERLAPIVQALAEYEGFYFHKKALDYRDLRSQEASTKAINGTSNATLSTQG